MGSRAARWGIYPKTLGIRRPGYTNAPMKICPSVSRKTGPSHREQQTPMDYLPLWVSSCREEGKERARKAGLEKSMKEIEGSSVPERRGAEK